MLHRIKRKEDVHYGKWNGLGGKIEAGESPEEALKREVKEESGLFLKSYELRGILTFPAFGGEDWYVFVYTSAEFEGNLLVSSLEGELRWVDDREILNLELWEADRIFLKWIEADQFFSAKFCYGAEGNYIGGEWIFYGEN